MYWYELVKSCILITITGRQPRFEYRCAQQKQSKNKHLFAGMGTITRRENRSVGRLNSLLFLKSIWRTMFMRIRIFVPNGFPKKLYDVFIDVQILRIVFDFFRTCAKLSFFFFGRTNSTCRTNQFRFEKQATGWVCYEKQSTLHWNEFVRDV